MFWVTEYLKHRHATDSYQAEQYEPMLGNVFFFSFPLPLLNVILALVKSLWTSQEHSAGQLPWVDIWSEVIS